MTQKTQNNVMHSSSTHQTKSSTQFLAKLVIEFEAVFLLFNAQEGVAFLAFEHAKDLLFFG